MSLKRKQTGSLYIVVIFVLVVMGFLAMSLSRIEWSNNDAHTKDIIGLQAALLAHSANELALIELYPFRSSPSAAFDVSGACSALSGAVKTIPSAVDCQGVQISCEPRGGELADGKRLYVIRSEAICGTGINTMQRSQEVWVRE
ncbi:MSHA biogenesis protein MshP [Vibrio japonicus]|uniref:MSHA biogenesis protein MshP n=1 Tax=Vibrio japonicus TaxID=1824638 RepID=A0ABY5LJ43_9VIBR|nr:MSHA biogenesis protein MshP [Vibrio japonicus]UUM30915.1 MSHA biogenesis protein MshP [Vibrio japonicus]